MIGNDVVDLQLAAKQSNWRRPNYLQKICTSLEIDAINSSNNPDNLVWEIWSRKEAVYKLLLQKGIKKGYYPKKIECLNFGENGIVSYQNQRYYTQTKVLDNCIHSIAVEYLIDFCLIKISKNNCNIIKTKNIPYYLSNGNKYPFSKSHHGAFEIQLYLDKVL
jgi:phosphopantetheinyl transferase (holo-ACP synthase)